MRNNTGERFWEAGKGHGGEGEVKGDRGIRQGNKEVEKAVRRTRMQCG